MNKEQPGRYSEKAHKSQCKTANMNSVPLKQDAVPEYAQKSVGVIESGAPLRTAKITRIDRLIASDELAWATQQDVTRAFDMTRTI